jgi:hypothetical protein
MTAEQELRNGIADLERQYVMLTGPSSSGVDPSTPTSDVAEFIARSYALLWDHSKEQSPYLYAARRVLEGSLTAPAQADRLVGILRGLLHEVDSTGYCDPLEASDYWQSYERFSTSVRNWLIAYGVGGPVLLVSQDSVAARVLASGQVAWIGGFFLAGVLLQVVKGIAYRTTSWYGIESTQTPESHTTWQMRVSQWINGAVWLEVLCDVVTIALFAVATALAVRAIS